MQDNTQGASVGGQISFGYTEEQRKADRESGIRNSALHLAQKNCGEYGYKQAEEIVREAEVFFAFLNQ